MRAKAGINFTGAAVYGRPARQGRFMCAAYGAITAWSVSILGVVLQRLDAQLARVGPDDVHHRRYRARVTVLVLRRQTWHAYAVEQVLQHPGPQVLASRRLAQPQVLAEQGVRSLLVGD